MKFKRGKSRRSIAGIVATVIMFAILFTVGTSYFLFVNSQNNSYVQGLLSASTNAQGRATESLTVTAVTLSSNGHIGFYVNDTSGLNANVTTSLLLSSSGSILTCTGHGLAANSCTQQASTFVACTNTACSTTQNPAPSFIEVNAGKGSPSIDTGYLPVSGLTYLLKVVTQRGNEYAQTYPEASSQYANQAQTSGSITVNMNTFRWVHLIPQATSLVQTGFAQNCNSNNCAKQFGSSVTAGNILVYGVGWSGNNPPNTPTDTLGSAFSLAASASVTSNAFPPTLVQDAYSSNCNSSSCAKAFGSNVVAGDILVYGLGWYANSPPSTPTDTRGNSYSLAASQSVTAGGSPSLVQSGFAACGASSCAKQFGSAVTTNDVLVAGVGWNNHAPPTSVSDTFGNTFTLQTSVALGGTPTVPNTQNENYCSNSHTCQTGKIKGLPAGDVIVLAIGWASSSAPTISDSEGDTFTLGVTNSVTVSAVTYYSSIYYATASASNDEIVTATFGGNTNSAVTLYDVTQVATTGLSSSTGQSSSGVTSGAVTSFTPTANSVVIAEIQNSAAPNYNGPSPPYGVPGGPGPCNGPPGTSCSIDGVVASGATTAPDTWMNSAGYTEAALAFPPSGNAVNTAIYTATSSSSGTDTITASFSSGIGNGGISVYEVSQATTSGLQFSTGSLNGGPGSNAAVTSFTPASNSFVIGNIDAGVNPGYGQGAGYTQISGGGGCNPTWACSEYASGVGSATTVPENTGGPGINIWAECAISLPPAQVTYYSYIWYATAGSSASDTVTASFSYPVVGSVSIYEIRGATLSGLLTSTGSSSSASATSTVTAFTVNPNSILVANSETGGGDTITAGGSYTLSGSCNNVYGCGEYGTGLTGSKSATFNLSPSSPFAEVAVDFAPAAYTFYSYIWTATAAASGTDTITASFSSAVAGTVSIYELNGYSSSSISSSTGSSSASSTAAAVSSFTPSAQSFVVGNVETGISNNNIAQGAGYTIISGGGMGCGSAYGCSEYLTSASGSTTTPLTLGTSSPWVEAAISLSAPINPQSGIQVGGYPTLGIPTGAQIAFEATFTNTDPQERTVTLWPQSVISVSSVENTGNAEQSNFFIVDSLNAAATTVVAYGSTNSNFLTLAYNVPVTLYFGSATPQGNQTVAIDNNVDGPFYAFFSLSGLFSNNKLYGQTIPFPYGIITGANAYTTPTARAHGSTVTMSCTGGGGNCGFNACPSIGQPGPGGPGDCNKDTGAQNAFIAWIDSAGTTTTLTTFRTTPNGGLPNNLQFTVPNNATPGFYTVMVSDYENTVFMTFDVTS